MFPGYPDIPAPEFCALGVETSGGLFVCASAGIAARASENAKALTIFFIVPTSLVNPVPNVPGWPVFPCIEYLTLRERLSRKKNDKRKRPPNAASFTTIDRCRPNFTNRPNDHRANNRGPRAPGT